MKLDTLYKRTNAGKIQEWTIEVLNNQFRTISGQTDGKKVTSEWTVCEGKNVGRSNETTPDEQALAEAQARFTKQLDKHYHRDIKNADKAKFVKAMLAHKYEDQFDGDFTNLYSQPKLDGMRCLVTKDGMFSRGGKPILSAPHIFETLKNAGMWNNDENLVFDGELYASHLRDDFEKLISLAKKSKPKPEDLEESAKHLEYWIYDVISDNNENFTDRFNRLENWFHHWLEGYGCIVLTPTKKVRDQEQMDELYHSYLEAGQEGQMLRKGDSLYEGKRSKNLLKRKEFIDEEYEIVSLNEGQGNYAGYIKALTLTNGKVTFNAGIKGNQEYLKSLMDNPEQYVGSDATVRYQNLTSDGIPRFPVVYHIWEGKRDV